jgi:hypothetical protein
MSKHTSDANDWATKVLLLVRGGNVTGAINQIKASANIKEVQQLVKLVDASKPPVRSPEVNLAVSDQLHTLSHPRLHRSP